MTLPDGHTPVASSAMKSYRYDPESDEFHINTGVAVYVYGPVTARAVELFEKHPSKGRAWQDIRKFPLIATIVGGKRHAA